MSAQPVGAVVVHYRTPEALRRCLLALEAQSPPLAAVVVVDNSAAERSEQAPPVEMGNARWLPAEGNVGFAAACNAGAAALDTPRLLILNADVELEPEATARLAAALDADPRCAVAAPRIFGTDGEVELNARRFPSLSTGVLGRASLLTALLRRTGRVPPALAPSVGAGGTPDWVSGACMLLRADAFHSVGGFDAGYWMYWEDADLCRRLRSAGWEVRLEPAAVARHATSSSGTSERTVRAFHASAERYFVRHMVRRPRLALPGRAALRARMHLVLRSRRRSGR